MAVEQKLTQYYKTIIFQLKKKKKNMQDLTSVSKDVEKRKTYALLINW